MEIVFILELIEIKEFLPCNLEKRKRDSFVSIIESDIENNSLNGCSECGGLIILDKYKQELICFNCGLVNQKCYTNTYSYTNNDAVFAKNKYNRTQIGPPENIYLPNKGLGTRAMNFSPNKKYSLDLKRSVKRQYYSKDDRYFQYLQEIKGIAKKLRVPKQNIKDIIDLFKLARETFHVHSIIGLIGGCIIYISRKNNLPVDYELLSTILSYSKKKISYFYKKLITELSLPGQNVENGSLIPYYISKLDIIDSDLENKANCLLSDFVKLDGRSTRMVCLASIFLIMTKVRGYSIAKATFAQKFNISYVGLSQNIAKIIKKVNLNSYQGDEFSTLISKEY